MDSNTMHSPEPTSNWFLSLTGVLLIFGCLVGWILDRVQLERKSQQLQSKLDKAEAFQDTMERKFASIESGSSVADHPYLYAFADEHYCEGHKCFEGAFRYVTRDADGVPPPDCDILYFEYLTEETEGVPGDFMLLIRDGVVCTKRFGETLQY